MSHDFPTGQRGKENEFNYHLTLSGHTHGLQFGIEIPGFLKFSPVVFMYKYCIIQRVREIYQC